MFEQTAEIYFDLKHKKELESKTLPLQTKLRIADECLQLTTDRQEFLEITEIRKRLAEELTWELKGIYSKREYFTNEEAATICEAVNKEIESANKQYRQLQEKAESIRLQYLENIESVMVEMSKVNAGFRKVNEIRYSLPDGFKLKSIVNIPENEIKAVTAINEKLEKWRLA